MLPTSTPKQLTLFPILDRMDILHAECRRLQDQNIAPNTKVNYACDWRAFRTWCDQFHVEALPASSETLALFIADQIQSGMHCRTAERRAYAVVAYHRLEGKPSPMNDAVRDLLRGARRDCMKVSHQMQPLTVEQLQHIAQILADKGTPIATRDRAIILLGFASALRRANLRALDIRDIKFCKQGLIIRVRREKQDQEGKGRDIGVPFGSMEVTCPVRALQAWIKHRGPHTGPLFTPINDFNRCLGFQKLYIIVKQAIDKAGFDSKNYGPHSLRAGFVTAAGEKGYGHLLISDQTGHKSLSSLQRYFRHVDLFKVNPAAGLL